MLALLGCGGGGGGSGGTGVDPIEVEVGPIIDAFFVNHSTNNLSGAMEYIDSNLVYRRKGDETFYQYSQYKNFLEKFLTGAASITISISNRYIVSNGEDSASVGGTLTYSYLDSKKVLQQYSETCEIVMERVSKWGIKNITGHALDGLNYPPTP